MANLTENLSIGWYGICEGCDKFELYNETSGELNADVDNIESITQIKDGGFVYATWLKERDIEKRNSWTILPTIIKDNLSKVDWVKDGQGFTELECGVPYLLKLKEGTSLNIENFNLAGLGHEDAGRVIECVECPTHPNCICEE